MKAVLKQLSTSVRAFFRVAFSTPAEKPYVSANCNNINMLLMHLCDFDQERYSYILKWLAYPLRHPGAKMRYGLALNSMQGTGVSMFFQDVAIALHQGAGRSIDIHRFRDHLNSQWAGAPLLLVDGDFHRASAQIKHFVTSDSITVRGVGRVCRDIPNHMNFIFVSGHSHALGDDSDNRRFLVLDTPPPRERVFYQAVASEIKNGGVEAFRHFLLHGIDMGGFNETTMPPDLRLSCAPQFNGRRLQAVKGSPGRANAATGAQTGPAAGSAA